MKDPLVVCNKFNHPGCLGAGCVDSGQHPLRKLTERDVMCNTRHWCRHIKRYCQCVPVQRIERVKA